MNPKDIENPIAEEDFREQLKKELCPCCDGTSICEDIDGNEGACLTCDGRGQFTYEDKFTKEEKMTIAKCMTMLLYKTMELRPQRLTGYCNDIYEDLKENGLEGIENKYDEIIRNL